jgi:UDP-glucose 4-epimerase
LRFATIYGERQHAPAVNANYIAEVHDAVRAGKAPQIPGDGSEVHDYIYVTDAASALMKAYKSRNSGLRLNISSDADSNLVQLVRAVLKACRREDLEPVMVPDTRAVRSYTATSLHFSNKLARETIDWVPSLSLEEGVSLFIRWRENHLERSKEAAT